MEKIPIGDDDAQASNKQIRNKTPAVEKSTALLLDVSLYTQPNYTRPMMLKKQCAVATPTYLFTINQCSHLIESSLSPQPAKFTRNRFKWKLPRTQRTTVHPFHTQKGLGGRTSKEFSPPKRFFLPDLQSPDEPQDLLLMNYIREKRRKVPPRWLRTAFLWAKYATRPKLQVCATMAQQKGERVTTRHNNPKVHLVRRVNSWLERTRATHTSWIGLYSFWGQPPPKKIRHTKQNTRHMYVWYTINDQAHYFQAQTNFLCNETYKSCRKRPPAAFILGLPDRKQKHISHLFLTYSTTRTLTSLVISPVMFHPTGLWTTT